MVVVLWSLSGLSQGSLSFRRTRSGDTSSCGTGASVSLRGQIVKVPCLTRICEENPGFLVSQSPILGPAIHNPPKRTPRSSRQRLCHRVDDRSRITRSRSGTSMPGTQLHIAGARVCPRSEVPVLGSDIMVYTWTSKMAKIMDPILPILSILGYWAIILGSFGGPGSLKQLYKNSRLRTRTKVWNEFRTPRYCSLLLRLGTHFVSSAVAELVLLLPSDNLDERPLTHPCPTLVHDCRGPLVAP